MARNNFKHAFLFVTTAALALGAMSANAITVNTLVFQGVTWTTTSVDADSMTLRIENALSSGSGNWANIAWLWTLQVDPIGTVTSAIITPNGQSNTGGELNANGCAGGNSGKACFVFDPVMALTDNMLFTVDFVGGSLDMEGLFHVKVGFLCEADGSPVGKTPPAIVPKGPGNVGTDACGSLMSKDIFTASSSSTSSGGDTSTSSSSSSGNQVPAPASTLVLLGLGLLGFGFTRRMKRSA